MTAAPPTAGGGGQPSMSPTMMKAGPVQDLNSANLFDAKSELPYMDVPISAQTLFPSWGATNKALLYFNRAFYYRLQGDNATGAVQAKLIETNMTMTTDCIYLLDDESTCHRCLRIPDLTAIKNPKDVKVIKASLGKDLAGSSALTQMKTGMLFSFSPPEPDLYVGFNSEEAQQGVAKRLAKILKTHYPAMKIKFHNVATVEECRPQLAMPPGYVPRFMDPPNRNRFVGGNTRGTEASRHPQDKPLFTPLTEEELGGGNGLGGGGSSSAPAKAAGGAEPKGSPFNVLQAGNQYIDVPTTYQKAHPPLINAAVRYVGKIRYFKDDEGWRSEDIRESRGEAGPMLGIGFITDRHLYLAREGKYLRCVPLNIIKKVKLRASKSAVTGAGKDTKRYSVLLILQPDQHDCLFDAVSKDVATEIFNACKANDPDKKPEAGGFQDPQEEKANFMLPADYRLIVPPVPRHPNSPNYKARLIRFYEVYAPEKVHTADAILDSFSGREEDMFAQLVSKYGPEPPPPVGAGDHTGQNKLSPQEQQAHTRARLTRYYEKYDRSKLANVDLILERSKGKEEAMFSSLVTKYGPEPPEHEDNFRSRLVRFYEKHDQEKVKNVDAIVAKSGGNEERVMSQLVEKYGPEPINPNRATTAKVPRARTREEFRERLDRFFTAHCPENLYRLDDEVAKGWPKQEEYMADMVARFGAEPGTQGVQIRPATNSAASALFDDRGTGKVTDYRGRLVRFCAKYIPARVAHVDDALSQNAGREEEMMEDLVRKYGPEPPLTLSGDGPEENYRNRLLRFFYKYDPPMVASVDDTLAHMEQGQEEEAFRSLAKKYGPEPPVRFLTTQVRLLNYTRRYFPDRLSDVPRVLEENKGEEEVMFAKLATRFGPEPSYPLWPHRDRLLRFAETYTPEKVHGVDDVLSENQGSEEKMFATLVSMYGPEPYLEKTDKMFLEDRLIRYYQRYDPPKVKIMDQVLAKYKGEEEELFDLLVHQYGPEPRHKDLTLHGPTPTEIYQEIDMTSQLPYAEVPMDCVTLFPTLPESAIFWFSAVGYWQKPKPVAHLYIFLSATHLYVASTDRIFQRCVPLHWIRSVFINSKKNDVEVKSMTLLKVYPKEHDILLVWEEEYTSKQFLWVLLEVIAKYHFGHQCPARSVAAMDDPGIDAQCDVDDYYVTPLVLVPKRKTVTRSKILSAIDEPLDSVAARKLAVMQSDTMQRRGEKKPVPGLTKNEVFGTVPQHATTAFGAATSPRTRGKSAATGFDAPEYHSSLGPPIKASLTPQTSFGTVAGGNRQAANNKNAAAASGSPAGYNDKYFMPHREVDDPVAADENRRADEMYHFLQMMELQHFHPLFLQRGLSMGQLKRFTEEDLSHYGVTYHEERQKILKGAKDPHYMRKVQERSQQSKEARFADTGAVASTTGGGYILNQGPKHGVAGGNVIGGGNEDEPSFQEMVERKDAAFDAATKDRQMNAWRTQPPDPSSPHPGNSHTLSTRDLDDFAPDETGRKWEASSLRHQYEQKQKATPMARPDDGFLEAQRTFNVPMRTPNVPEGGTAAASPLAQYFRDQGDGQHLASPQQLHHTASLGAVTTRAMPPSTSPVADATLNRTANPLLTQREPYATPYGEGGMRAPSTAENVQFQSADPMGSYYVPPVNQRGKGEGSPERKTVSQWKEQQQRRGLPPNELTEGEKVLSLINEVQAERSKEATKRGYNIPPALALPSMPYEHPKPGGHYHDPFSYYTSGHARKESPPRQQGQQGGATETKPSPGGASATNTWASPSRTQGGVYTSSVPSPAPSGGLNQGMGGNDKSPGYSPATAHNVRQERFSIGDGISQPQNQQGQYFGPGGSNTHWRNNGGLEATPRQQLRSEPQITHTRPMPLNVDSLTVGEVAQVLEFLGLDDYKGNFKRTNGSLLNVLLKEDLRHRFRGDHEATDIMWNWIQDRHMRYLQEQRELESVL